MVKYGCCSRSASGAKAESSTTSTVFPVSSKARRITLLNTLPQDVVEGVVFAALLGSESRAVHDSSDKDERRLILYSLRGSCRGLREASSLRSIARRCLSSPCILQDLLLAQRRVLLHRFLRLSGGYPFAVQVFVEEIERVRGLQPAVPLPIVATLCKLTGRLFTQISAYSEVFNNILSEFVLSLFLSRSLLDHEPGQAEKLLQTALQIDKQEQGAHAEQVASTLHTLAEMLRGSVSACQVARERRQYAQRGLTYASECLAIRGAGLQNCIDAEIEGGPSSAPVRVALANALHLLGYHCAEFASGLHAKGYFEQATGALSRAHAIFRELGDDEMTATVLQDLGLCYYYQRRYKEAMALYTSACHVIIEKLGSCHPDLAVPTFNIANIMCAADEYGRAIDFYRIAYSINVRALGGAHAWTKTAWSSLQEAVEYQKQSVAAGHVVVELQFNPDSNASEAGPHLDAELAEAEAEAGPDVSFPATGAELKAETTSLPAEGSGSERGGRAISAHGSDGATAECLAADRTADDQYAHPSIGRAAGQRQGGERGRGGGAAAGKNYAVLNGEAIAGLLQRCLQQVDIQVEDEMDLGAFHSDSDEENTSDTDAPGTSAASDNQLYVIEKQLQVGR